MLINSDLGMKTARLNHGYFIEVADSRTIVMETLNLQTCSKVEFLSSLMKIQKIYTYMCLRGKTCELKNYQTKREQNFSTTTTCLPEQLGEDGCHI